MEKELVVPREMLLASINAQIDADTYEAGMQAAIEWLAKNPPLPAAMVDQVACMIWSYHRDNDLAESWSDAHEAVKQHYRNIAQIACKITFAQAFKPEPEIPKDLSDLVLVGAADETINMSRGGLNALLLEAYSRGKQAQPKIIEQATPVSNTNTRSGDSTDPFKYQMRN
jgi:hypothetical protein